MHGTGGMESMTGELKPCPFCGGEAVIAQSDAGCWSVVCKRCNTGIFRPRCNPDEWNAYATEAEAIEAWNRRAERTCHTVSMDCFGNPPFNTSGFNGNSTACGCSECGAPWSTMGIFRGNQLSHNFRACPICGAKVVTE